LYVLRFNAEKDNIMSPLDLTPNIFLDGMQVWGYFSDMLVKANSYHPSEEKAINGRCPYYSLVSFISLFMIKT